MNAFLHAILPHARRAAARLPLAVAGLAVAGLVATPSVAQGVTYGRVIANDMSACAPGNGPAVRVLVTDLKSGKGNLFVRTYIATTRDWLVSKRYFVRVDAKPLASGTTVCVPLPAAGDYAISVHHDANGNRKSDLADGAGMSNNPKIKKILGLIPRAPELDKVRFTAGEGTTRMTINMRYM